MARAGEAAGAEELAAELDKTFHLDTRVQEHWLPTIRAGVVLEHKDPNSAIELLKTVRPLDLGQPTNINSWLCPVYVRGEACLMLHDGNRAAVEFQKFIDRRGLVMNFPWGALAPSAWRALTPCKEIRPKPAPSIRTFSPFGTTRTPMFPC